MIYRDMLSNQNTVDSDNRCLTVKFFHWIMFSVKPLRLRELRHILAFIQSSPPNSLREWVQFEHYLDNDQRLERRINHISRGLVEVSRDSELDVSDKDQCKPAQA